jgi:hypothetical protein
MTGRLQIDMYASFRREFILSSYKLDDVAGLFISDDIKKSDHIIHPTFGEVTELYSQNLMGININDFIHKIRNLLNDNGESKKENNDVLIMSQDNNRLKTDLDPIRSGLRLIKSKI